MGVDQDDKNNIVIKEKKKKFRMVETDERELEQKLRAHRRKIMRRTLIVIVVILALFFGFYLYLATRTFTDYTALNTVERSDTAAAQFEEFDGNILKYSNDGALYTDKSDHMIWNQTYEMQNPKVDICQGYLAIFDRGGTAVYILTKDGMQGNIKTTMPISRVCVASQGTIAVLMREDTTSYLQLYNKEGELLASGELHQENSGYPLTIALSDDAKKLAVSMLDIGEGKLQTTIAFYNFGSVGQNEIDNIVASYTYSDEVFPQMEFLNSNRMVAFGDSSILLFEGTQKPKVTKKTALDKQIKSVFYNTEYIGVVYNNEDSGNTRHVEVYDMKGKQVLSKDFDMDYSRISFLDNNEICVTSDVECRIYSLYGVERFRYMFDRKLYRVMSGATQMNYTFILDGTTEKVRLK